MKILLAFLAIWGAAAAAPGQDDRAELERLLHETLDGARLVGHFTVAGADGVSRPPQTEQYSVSRLERAPDGRWVFHASMSYGTQQQTLPVPVTIEWAGSTPMITMTEQTIVGLGTFTARVLLYDGLYAGTWKHGQFGGHMYGRIEQAGAAAPPDTNAAPASAPQADVPDAAAPAAGEHDTVAPDGEAAPEKPSPPG